MGAKQVNRRKTVIYRVNKQAAQRFLRASQYTPKTLADARIPGLGERYIKDLFNPNNSRRFSEKTIKGLAQALSLESWSQLVIPEDMPDNEEVDTDARILYAEILSLIQNARQSRSAYAAKDNLLRAHRMIRDKPIFSDKLIVADSMLFSELAAIDGDHMQRAACRMKAINILDNAKSPNSYDVVIQRARATINYFYDDCGFKNWPKLRHYLALADGGVTVASYGESNLRRKAILLATKSEILRCRSQRGSYRIRRGFLCEMDSCSEHALKIASDSSAALLERSQALWAIAMTIPADRESEYYEIRDAALKYSHDSARYGYALAFLVRARICRQSYMFDEAARAFIEYERCENNHSRFLRESYLMGEIAIHLLYKNKRQYCDIAEYACRILGEALDAGFCFARPILVLARLTAKLRGPSFGNTILAKLSRNRTDDIHDIHDMCNLAAEYVDKSDIEALRSMFVLGLDGASKWNLLATYVFETMEDNAVALTMYDGGLRMEANNQVLLVNKARVLLRMNKKEEAQIIIQRARNCCTASFKKWIDEVENEINTKSVKKTAKK